MREARLWRIALRADSFKPAANAVAALAGFAIRKLRAANPLYDLHVAGRRVFWVAACAGILVFGSPMGALFVG